MPKADVLLRDDVPPKVKANVSTFWTCANAGCDKLFWEGPKFDSAVSKFTTMIRELTDGGPSSSLSAFMGEGGSEEEEEEGEEGMVEVKAAAAVSATAPVVAQGGKEEEEAQPPCLRCAVM